jgi:ankyrin repeat protein
VESLLSDGQPGYLRLFKLIPLLMVVGFMAWCSSNKGGKPEVQQVRVELSDLMSTQGYLSGPADSENLPGVAKRVGPAGMNRLLYDSAPTASLAALKWMVKNGADPKNTGAIGEEPLLHRIARIPQPERLEYFIGMGLDPKERSRDGATLLHVAARNGLGERALALLTSKGLAVSDATTLGKQPIHMASVKAIPVLAGAGADISAKDSSGRTPLHWAALEGKHEQVSALLRMNASVFATDNKGRTPLHLAAMGNSEEVVDTLLAAGAPRAVRDQDNMTPRELAQESRKNRNYRYRDLTEKL